MTGIVVSRALGIGLHVHTPVFLFTAPVVTLDQHRYKSRRVFYPGLFPRFSLRTRTGDQ